MTRRTDRRFAVVHTYSGEIASRHDSAHAAHRSAAELEGAHDPAESPHRRALPLEVVDLAAEALTSAGTRIIDSPRAGMQRAGRHLVDHVAIGDGFDEFLAMLEEREANAAEVHGSGFRHLRFRAADRNRMPVEG